MTQNYVTQYLPACYRQGDEQEEIALALTQGVADKCAQLLEILENYEKDYLDPETAKPEWLDVLAAWSAWGTLWNTTWSVEQKRQLLKESNYIWENRGNRTVLELLFKIFNLTVQLAPQSGLILNVSVFNPAVALGFDPFDLIVKVPATYAVGTPERKLVERVLRDFAPCWISLSYQVG